MNLWGLWYNNIFKSSKMSIQGDLRQRQSKRKIFLDDSYKSRIEEPITYVPLIPRKSTVEVHHSHSIQQPKPKIDELQTIIKELKAILKEEREKYDQLFEEYEELIEKNNLIEKEYINLKYDHNKEIKNLKKSYKEKVQEEIKRYVQDFMAKINEECIWQGIKSKIEKFIMNIERISQIFLQKSKKYQSKDMQKSFEMMSMTKSRKIDQIIEESKVQKTEMREISSEQKIIISPSKDQVKQFEQIVNNSLNTKEIIFQDEYYGDLDDYQHLEEKIILRKNYELMKNCNRNSADIRRKKIFNKNGQFQ